MGHRDPRVRRGGDAGGYPGHDLEVDSGRGQRLGLLAAAAEDERIAALEPHHAPPRPRPVDQQRLDVVLLDGVVAGALADVDELGVGAGAGERAPRG